MSNKPIRYDFTHEHRMRYLMPVLALLWVPMVTGTSAVVIAFFALVCRVVGVPFAPLTSLAGFAVGSSLSAYAMLRIERRFSTCPHRRNKPLFRFDSNVRRLDRFDACPLCSGPPRHEPEPQQAINVPYGKRVPVTPLHSKRPHPASKASASSADMGLPMP